MTPVWYQSITDVIGLHQASTQQADVCEDFGNTDKCSPSNPGHTSSSPAPAKSLQSALHNAQLVWCSPVRHGFQAAHGLISDTRWMPLLAVCHSSNPPRNSSATAVRRHKKTSSSSLKFLGIGLSVKPEHKVRKKVAPFPNGSLHSENKYLFPITNAGVFRLIWSVSCYSGKTCQSFPQHRLADYQLPSAVPQQNRPQSPWETVLPGSFLKRLF